MAIQNFFTSRDNKLDGNTYVGQLGRLWYNPDTNSIYASDGSTVGGIPVALATNANILANNITVSTVTSTSGNITVNGNLVINGNISPATDVKIGGIKAGPGANISNDGTLTIDTTGLPLSFGNFTANNNILTIVNVDEDMILETSGNAEIQLVGNIGFYKPNGGGVPEPSAKYFFARDDGQITILVPVEDPFLGAVEIIGSSTGNVISPGAPGAMLHLTGNPSVPTRLYMDGNNSYASIVGRRWNGNVATPTQVLAGQDVLRINATAATDAGSSNVGNVAFAQVRMTALETQTAAAQGSQIVFTVTPVGQPATSRVDVANITVADGVWATKFTTTGNVSAANAIISGNISVAGSILGNAVTTTATIGTGNITTLNVSGNATVGGNIRYNIANNNATVTQATSKATAVTCNGRTGQITTSNSSIAKGEAITFTVNNSYITAATDVPVVVLQSGATANSYSVSVTRVQPGSFAITLVNNGTGPLSDTIVINFAVIKVS